jgi:hypothetical protein
MGTLSKNLAVLAGFMHRAASAPLSVEEVRSVRDLAHEMNKAVTRPEP